MRVLAVIRPFTSGVEWRLNLQVSLSVRNSAKQILDRSGIRQEKAI